ncbi:MAG: sulfate adenylyltransferase, partial [Thermoprotei archaeon]
MVSKPHGGRLINRILSGEKRERIREEAKEIKVLEIPLDIGVDVENIAYGVFSPLEGFMTSDDYFSVLHNMRLNNDLPWTIPIT